MTAQVTRYVIRFRADAMQPTKWCPVTRKWAEYEPHPRRGEYLMDGGHFTQDIQDAKVFRADVMKGRAWRPAVHELVEVTLVVKRPTVYRGRK